MANGFAQAGDFFARAMQKQEQAANWQQRAQLPTTTNFAGIAQDAPGTSTFKSSFQTATLPALESAATGSSLRDSPEIVSELLSKARAKRAQTAFDATAAKSSIEPAAAGSMVQPPNGSIPEISTVGARVTPSARGQRIPPKFGGSIRAGQVSA